MFNTYQELVDRINALLEEREKQRKKYQRMIDIFTLTPPRAIDYMYRNGDITQEERIYWEILHQRKKKENVKTMNKENN